MNTKKNILRTLSAFVIGLSLLAQSPNALASRAYEVRIYNMASQAIFAVYASNIGDPDWGYDRLGNGVIISGDSLRLDLDDGSGRCAVDLKVVFRNGHQVIRRNVNVCQVVTWRIGDVYNGFVYA